MYLNTAREIKVCKKELAVYPGAVIVRSGGEILRTSPLGSCIALSAYDPATGSGGLAHIMLPGAARPGTKDKYRYSSNATIALLGRFKRKGISLETLKFVVAGGANVMRAADNSVSDLNIKAVLNELKKRGLETAFKFVGGVRRRVIVLNLATGKLYGSLGSEKMKEIYCFGSENGRSKNFTERKK